MEDERTATACRVLRIEEEPWRRFLEHRAALPKISGMEERIAALAGAWADCCPHRMPLPSNGRPGACLICGQTAVRPAVAKKPDIVYGRCSNCGHGPLLAPPLDDATYAGADYYRARSAGGSGYSAYRAEQRYREEKARRLFEWAGLARGRMVEVGSGFGYSRKAAEDLGWSTAGVDLNPHAAAAARELYGIETFTGNLDGALEAGAVAAGEWDLVLYQFVLEHVDDPAAELARAASLLAPGGAVLLLVPGMDAFERRIFAASYRSFRADHLHIFSWASLDRCVARAGLRRERSSSECGVHLLAGLLDPDELAEMYRSGAGPDMLALARKDRECDFRS